VPALLATRAVASDAKAITFSLPLGDADLLELRTTEVLTRGVTLTRIVGGLKLAPTALIGIGHLEATYGLDLSRVEKPSALVGGPGP
jgi:hypothetical protein